MFDISQYIPVFDFDEFKSIKQQETSNISYLDILSLLSSSTLLQLCSNDIQVFNGDKLQSNQLKIERISISFREVIRKKNSSEMDSEFDLELFLTCLESKTYFFSQCVKEDNFRVEKTVVLHSYG